MTDVNCRLVFMALAKKKEQTEAVFVSQEGIDEIDEEVDEIDEEIKKNSRYGSRSLKMILLVILVMQNSSMVLLVKASRNTQDEVYFASTVIFFAEAFKCLLCHSILFIQHISKKEENTILHFCEYIKKDIWNTSWQNMKILVPAVLYVIQNNLLFIAFHFLDAATFQVTSQIKILTTAIFFSFCLMKKNLNLYQWISLIILFLGVSIVQYDILGYTNNNQDKVPEKLLIGLICLIISCMLSGFSGVYLEMVLKQSKPSVWVRNAQLSLFSLVPSLFAIYLQDYEEISKLGIFYGYNTLVWCVVLMQGCSGLLVALVLVYSDNIVKGFATSISIVVSSSLSCIIFMFQPSFMWLSGCFLVVLATILYYVASTIPLLEKNNNLENKEVSSV